MNNIKKYYILILYTLFFLSIFNFANSKNFEKYNNAKKMSNYFSGILHLNNNNYLGSYKNFKQLEGLEDSHYIYSRLYQYNLINLEKFDEAYQYTKKLKRKNISNFESDLISGVFYLKNKKFNLALDSFKSLKKNKNQNPIQKLLSINLENWLTIKDIDNKEDALAIILAKESQFKNFNKIQEAFIHCYYRSNETSKKFKNLVTDSKSDFSRYNFFHANYLYKNGKIENAKNIVKKTINIENQNLILNQLQLDMQTKKYENFSNKFDCKKLSNIVAELFYIIANVSSSNSMYSISNFYLNLAKYLNPDFISFERLYAENFFAINDLKNAKKLYLKISKSGSFYSWYSAKQNVKIFVRQNKIKEAQSYLDKTFIKIVNPSIYEIYDYAYFLKDNKKYKKSIIYYTKILKLINNKHKLYTSTTYGRGISYERIDNWKMAEKDFLDSLAANPNQAYVINYLAYSWIEKGINIDKSLQMLRKANELKKDDAYIIDSLGWALFKLKKFKEANKYLNLAVTYLPTDPVIGDHYADSLWMNNKTLQARYYWNHVLSLKEIDDKLKNLIEKKIIFGLSQLKS
jgi:tetratricopeptide (TPR) repeat protein